MSRISPSSSTTSRPVNPQPPDVGAFVDCASKYVFPSGAIATSSATPSAFVNAL